MPLQRCVHYVVHVVLEGARLNVLFVRYNSSVRYCCNCRMANLTITTTTYNNDYNNNQQQQLETWRRVCSYTDMQHALPSTKRTGKRKTHQSVPVVFGITWRLHPAKTAVEGNHRKKGADCFRSRYARHHHKQPQTPNNRGGLRLTSVHQGREGGRDDEIDGVEVRRKPRRDSPALGDLEKRQGSAHNLLRSGRKIVAVVGNTNGDRGGRVRLNTSTVSNGTDRPNLFAHDVVCRPYTRAPEKRCLCQRRLKEKLEKCDRRGTKTMP